MKTVLASKSGLTLVEVLLALIILSVGAGAMVSAMIRGMAVVREARKLEISRSLLLRVDQENPIEEVDMTEMSDSGTFDDFDGYEWSREIQMVDEENKPGLFLVTIRVHWSERNRDASEQITLFRYAPNAESVTSQL